MNTPAITALDLRAVEAVLEMGSGYVLDFTDRTYAAFFRDFGVDIDGPQFLDDGRSKANRLRCFLRKAPGSLAGRVLAELFRHRMAAKPQGLRSADVSAYRSLVLRLGGPPLADAAENSKGTGADDEAALLGRVFKPERFAKLPMDDAMATALVDRMSEARRCIEAKAYLASVILCGSVLEGMCLGYGSRNLERVNRGYTALFGKDPKRLHEWRLNEWIDVLARVGDLSPNIEKFGHGLRDFRNYVHPAEQLAHHFSPDEHTARIAFQVVLAAADDLTRAATERSTTKPVADSGRFRHLIPLGFRHSIPPGIRHPIPPGFGPPLRRSPAAA